MAFCLLKNIIFMNTTIRRLLVLLSFLSISYLAIGQSPPQQFGQDEDGIFYYKSSEEKEISDSYKTYFWIKHYLEYKTDGKNGEWSVVLTFPKKPGMQVEKIGSGNNATINYRECPIVNSPEWVDGKYQKEITVVFALDEKALNDLVMVHHKGGHRFSILGTDSNGSYQTIGFTGTFSFGRQYGEIKTLIADNPTPAVDEKTGLFVHPINRLRTDEPLYTIHRTDKSKIVEVLNVQHLRLGDYHDGFMVVRNEGSYHIYNHYGEKTGIVKTSAGPYESIPSFSNGKTIARLEDNRFYIIDTLGNKIKPIPELTEAAGIVDGLIVLPHDKVRDGYSYYDIQSGKRINALPLGYKSIDTRKGLQRPFKLNDGRRLFADHNTKKFGFLNEKFSIAIEPQFVKAHSFSEGVAAVAIERNGYQLWGYINTDGAYIIEPKYTQEPGDFHDGRAVIKKRSQGSSVFYPAYIDKDGKVLYEAEFLSDYCNGIAIAMEKGKTIDRMIIDKNFEVFSNDYTDLYTFTLVYSTGTIWFLSLSITSGTFSPENGWELFGTEAFEEEITKIKDKPGYVNREGEVILEFVNGEY